MKLLSSIQKTVQLIFVFYPASTVLLTLNSKTMTRHFIFFISIIVFISSCNQGEEKVTREEADKFAAYLENAALKHQSDFLTSSIIYSALSDRMQAQQKKSFNEDVERGLKMAIKKNQLEKDLFQLIGTKGSYEKVKIYEKDGKHHAIFRAFGDGGINYMDMELTSLNKKVGIADIFLFISGENLSKSLAELYEKSNNISEKQDKYLAQRMELVRTLIKQQSFEEAKKQLSYLPGSIRNTRVGNILKLQILNNLTDEKSKQELDKLEQEFAADPNIQLLMIDTYFSHKDYDKAMGAINQVDSIINKDPFLDYYRGLLCYMKGDKDVAINYYKKVTESNPAFPGAFAELFAMKIINNEKDDARKYFNKYKHLRNSDQQLVKRYEDLYPYLKEGGIQ